MILVFFGPMTALIIDTSTDRSLIAISKGKKILSFQVLTHGNKISKFLFPSISQLLDRCNIKMKELDYISVGTGPGSYTGTRVGATVAKSLSFALGLPVVGFCSLQAFLPDRNGSFAIAAATKMQQVFLLKGKIHEEETHLEEPCQIPLQDMPAALECTDLIVSPNPDLLKELFKSEQAEFNQGRLAGCIYEHYLKRENAFDNRLELTYFHNPAKF
ncbi:MAG TPA: tRNA (adenosine(37)-N6)-threonylcarbamoyltransferase complex dimerization subunit type 1 TsaB [Rhabdochlamydiaceae bacterium]|nr:tRNA (adenosine(37)-N6)-threonylcarbamoyltransferase complex dimerization subunit type 1 TsaB [Rhabdochlamydiaceae bacterium]